MMTYLARDLLIRIDEKISGEGRVIEFLLTFVDLFFTLLAQQVMPMPRKLIDFSKLSEDIRQEPWDLHFWESSPTELLDFVKNPRKELASMGIQLRPEVRVEITVENLDWISRQTQGFTIASTKGGDPIVVCGTGGGGGSTAAVGKDYYKVSFYGHLESHLAK